VVGGSESRVGLLLSITGIDGAGGIHKGNMELLKASPRSSKSGRNRRPSLAGIHIYNGNMGTSSRQR
jgi:hypothetical protein